MHNRRFFSETAQYQAPVFKLVNSATGHKLTAGDVGQPITLEADVDDPGQKW